MSYTKKEPLEYVIYVRKSKDEKGSCNPSIAEQIIKCIEYAQANGLTIMSKPKDFEFQTHKELAYENIEKDPEIRDLYKRTRNLFIIKERESARVPGRPKWDLLMKRVKEGRIKGILSYSPDRQARNISEASTLVSYANDNLVDLEYSNFELKPSINGILSLRLYFTFYISEQQRFSERVKDGMKKGRERREG